MSYKWNASFVFAVEKIILSGRTGKEIPENRTNPGLLFPSFVINLLKSQYLFSNGRTGPLQFT